MCLVVYESVRRVPVDCCVPSAREGDLRLCVVDGAHLSAPSETIVCLSLEMLGCSLSIIALLE